MYPYCFHPGLRSLWLRKSVFWCLTHGQHVIVESSCNKLAISISFLLYVNSKFVVCWISRDITAQGNNLVENDLPIFPCWGGDLFRYKMESRPITLTFSEFEEDFPSSSMMFQRFFIFTPIWGRFPFWLIFFRWVETTNQKSNLWSYVFMEPSSYATKGFLVKTTKVDGLKLLCLNFFWDHPK